MVSLPSPSPTPPLPEGSPGSSTASFEPVAVPQSSQSQTIQVVSMDANIDSRPTVIPRNRTAFVHLMRMWLVQTGRNSDAIPRIGEKPADLHHLFTEVETLGGPEKVQAAGLWRLVAVKMGYVMHEQNDPQLAQIAKVLADTYAALIVPFEAFCRERMRAIGTGGSTNPLNSGVAGMGGPSGLNSGVLPDGQGQNPMANFQRILAFLQINLKDWLPEQSAHDKLLRASQMDVAEMQRQGWPSERIAIIQRFRPALLQYRATLMRQQELQRQSQQSQPPTSTQTLQPPRHVLQLDRTGQAQASGGADSPGHQTAIPHDRTAFLQLMRIWFVQTGRNSDAIPIVEGKPVDLHRLHVELENLGGPEKVQGDDGLWFLVAVKMGYFGPQPMNSQLGETTRLLAEAYNVLLVPFGNFCRERVQAVGTGIYNNRLNLGVGGTGYVGRVTRGPDGVLTCAEGSNSMANLWPILASLKAVLKDWLPEQNAAVKMLRASGMDVPEMQRQGWPPQWISVFQHHRPALLKYRDIYINLRELGLLDQPGRKQQTSEAQTPGQPLKIWRTDDFDSPSSISKGPPPLQMQAPNSVMPGDLKLLFPPDSMNRAKMVAENMVREIEHTRQYQWREVPEAQRVQMNQSVVATHPFASEFERTIPLYFMLFNDLSQTRPLLEQAATIREQHRILQRGQQQYIMTLEDVHNAQNALRMAIHNLKQKYTAKVREDQEAIANRRENDNLAAGGSESSQQAQAQRVRCMPGQPSYQAPFRLHPTGELVPNSYPSQSQYWSDLRPFPKPESPKVKAEAPASPVTPRLFSKSSPVLTRKKCTQVNLPLVGFKPIKREHEDQVSLSEATIPVAGPSLHKRVKTDQAITSVKTEGVDALESTGFPRLEDDIDPATLEEITRHLDGTSLDDSLRSSPALQSSFDRPADAGPKVEDVFDFSYYINDTLEEDTLKAETSDNRPLGSDSDTDEEMTNPSECKASAGSRAPTLGQGFWEAFTDGEMH